VGDAQVRAARGFFTCSTKKLGIGLKLKGWTEKGKAIFASIESEKVLTSKVGDVNL
jgi:hypothetical protein